MISVHVRIQFFLLLVLLTGICIVYGEETPAAAGTASPAAPDAGRPDAGSTGSTAAADQKTIVTIKNARKTGNKKSELDGSDVIVLEGEVVVSVQKGDTTSTISADKINYNRENDMLYAEGSVSFKKENKNTGSETATANTLLFNTATLEGIFDNGRIVQTQSDSLNLPSGSTLIVASDVFGRDDSSTIAFKNGALTFCPEDPPHWRIKASRIWLLPGGEFAFFNAVLYVGRVPLLYLPAFWYPKDELIINPVFGFRNREGFFFQTTTYIFGRKPLSAYDVSDQYSSSSTSTSSTSTSTSSTDDDTEKDDSYYSFVKPSKLKNQERQGLLLHNLDTDYTGGTTNYAKIMADWYANLGYMVGFDSVYKPSDGNISDLETNLQLGFSNTVFPISGTSSYMSYAPSGKIYEDSSNFLGIKMPFRYSANIKFAVSKPFTLALSMPIYSDPYFTDDFGNRTETMDWIDYLISNPTSATTTDTESTTSEISSFTWSLTGSYSQDVPDLFKPFINTLSITSFTSQMIFTGKENTVITGTTNSDSWNSYTPERKFYYPSQINPIKLNLKIGGTLYSYSSTETADSAKTGSAAGQAPEAALIPPEDLASADAADKPAAPADASAAPADKEKAADTSSHTDRIPDIAFSPDAVKTLKGIDYALTYTITPSYTTEFTYSSTGLSQPEDFKWDRLKSTMYTVKIPTDLVSTLSYRESFVTLTDSLNFAPVYQWHPYLSTDTTYGGYTASGANAVKNSDYSAQKLDLTNTNALNFKPFYYTEHFKNTGLAWNTTVKVVRTEYTGSYSANGVDPEWTYHIAELTDENCVTVHTLDLTLAATELDDDFGQSLKLSTNLPPQVDEYYGVLTLTFPYTTLVQETGIKKTSSTDDTWIKEDYKETLAVNLGSSSRVLSQSYTYNLENSYKDSLKFALTWYDVQLAYTAKYTYGYDFDSDSGWKARSTKEFLPYNMSIAYATSKRTYRYWMNRISWAPTLSTSVVYDYLRPTNSYFKFIPAITFQVNKFLNITFASESRNDVIYRYFQAAAGHPGRISGETNMLQDLFDSFRFDDEAKRKKSGFKLNSFGIKITHELCDWDFSASFKVSPRYVKATTTSSAHYDFSPYFTISVVWRPMNGMKTKVVDKYGDWELNP